MVTTTRRGDRPRPGPAQPGTGFSGLGETGSNNFDLLRFALASLVVFSHSFPLLNGDNRREPLSLATGGQSDLGKVAVDGFFLISGFLVSQSWSRSTGALDFLSKRVRRVYPGFLVATALGALVFGPRLASSPSAYWVRFETGRFVRSALVLQAVYPRVFDPLPFPVLNGSLWTIAYEFECYLLMALLGSLGFSRGRTWPTLGLALAVGLYAGQTRPTGPVHDLLGGSPWPRFAACFLAGAWFRACRDWVPRSPGLVIGSLTGLALLAAFPDWHGFAPAFPLLGGYVLFSLASLQTPRLHQWARHGDDSYGLYLYAFPVQQWLVRSLGVGRLTPLTLFLLAYPAALLLAKASWRFVEAPCLRRTPRRSESNQSRVSIPRAAKPEPAASQAGPAQ